MRFVLFVEGHTENKAVPRFLKRWLDERLPRPVGVQAVRFEGWADLVRDAKAKARLHLGRDDVIAVISLLDLYGPDFYPPGVESAADREQWGRKHVEGIVGHPRFFQFFAVHETEAWLLSEPSLFPRDVRDLLPDKASKPEQVNFDEPPGRLLNRLYLRAMRKPYKKIVYGTQLFSKLEPDVACEKCPRLKAMLDEMLRLAKEAAG